MIIKLEDYPPYTHNLKNLAGLLELEFSTEDWDNLVELSKFNVSSRYPDIKNRAYQLATRFSTKKYFNFSKQLIKWLKQEYQI